MIVGAYCGQRQSDGNMKFVTFNAYAGMRWQLSGNFHNNIIQFIGSMSKAFSAIGHMAIDFPVLENIYHHQRQLLMFATAVIGGEFLQHGSRGELFIA